MYYRASTQCNEAFEAESLKELIESIAIFQEENDIDFYITELSAEYNNGREKYFCNNAIIKFNEYVAEKLESERESRKHSETWTTYEMLKNEFRQQLL